MQLCGAQQNMSNWDYCCSQNHEPHRPDVHLLLIPWSGAPILGTHKKMTEIDEQELHEVLRLKHHSHGLKNQYFGEFPLFRDQGVGGSSPLSPTILFWAFQGLSDIPILH